MTLTPRDRILLGVIVAVLAVFGFYHFALSPQRTQGASLDTKIAAQRTALARAESQYAVGDAAVKQLRASTSLWVAAERAVPENSDIPGLLRLLERDAKAAHVSLQSISLNGASSSSSATPGESTTTDGATVIPVSLSFGGGYQALNRLVQRLDGLVTASGQNLRASGPLVGITNVSLTGSGTGSGLAVQLTAAIYQHAAATTVLGPTAEGSS